MTDDNRYDIFVSYAHADRERVMEIIDALHHYADKKIAGKKLRIFTDWDIPNGEDYKNALRYHVDRSKVVGAISPISVGRPYVDRAQSTARRSGLASTAAVFAAFGPYSTLLNRNLNVA